LRRPAPETTRRAGRCIAHARGHSWDGAQRLRVDACERVGRRGRRGALGTTRRVLDLRPKLRLDLVFPLLRQEPLLDDVLLHALQRVLLAPQLDLLWRAV